MRRTILGLVLLVSIAGACAQQGENVPGPTGPSSPTVTSITIAGSLTMSNVGQTSQMTATAHYAKGTTENVTTQATWSSSDANIATVSNGLVTSVGTGTVTITATFKNVSGSTRVIITRPPTYTLSGLVTESVPHTSTAIVGVRLEVADGANKGKYALTDATGKYQIADVQTATFSVRATMAGYSDATKQVVLAGNSTLDFALVPTLQQLTETKSGKISGGDPACYSGNPCQVFDLPLHNTGALTAKLTWSNDAYLGLQLYSVDTSRVLADASVPDVRTQSISANMSAPGNYQLRVIAYRVSTITSFTIETTHTN